MKRNCIIIVLLSMLVFTSCKDSGVFMPNVSGAAFEVLLVIDNDLYRRPAGEAMFNVLNADVPKLPQPEPQFKMSRIDYNSFDQYFKTTRSIVFVFVDPEKYTKTTINLMSDQWAKTQRVVNITAASEEDLKEKLEENGQRIIDYLVEGERERQIEYIKESISQETLNRVYEMFGSKIAVTSSFDNFKEGENFLWVANETGTMQQNVVVYSLPYVSKNQLTKESLMAIRDSVMKVNIPGGMPGSYMGTEYKYDPPSFEVFEKNGTWCGEIRGLWDMKEGSPMGGPFVMHAQVDELNGRIVVVEGFVFAPAKEKRNALRQLEAMLYTVKLPHDVNAVTVTKN